MGYSALRIARQLPSNGHVYSVELSAANAALARQIIEHAGMGERTTIVVGHLGDGGKTLAQLREQCGFAPGTLDFVFLDHDKDVSRRSSYARCPEGATKPMARSTASRRAGSRDSERASDFIRISG